MAGEPKVRCWRDIDADKVEEKRTRTLSVCVVARGQQRQRSEKVLRCEFRWQF